MKSIRLYSSIIILSLLLFSACSFNKPKETSTDEIEEVTLMEGDVIIEEMTQKQKLQLPYNYGKEYLFEDLNQLEESTCLGEYAIIRVTVLNEPRENITEYPRYETITKAKVLEIYKKSETLEIKEGDTIKLKEDYWIAPDEDNRLILSSLVRCTPLENNNEYIVFTNQDNVHDYLDILSQGSYLISKSDNISEHQKSEHYKKMFEEVKAKYLEN